MTKTADDLKDEARLLWEAGEVYGLKPERLASYVDAPIDRIYEWLGSGEVPTDEEKAKIRAGVEKMKAEFEPKIAENGGAWWGNLSGDPVEPSPDELADRARTAVIQPLFTQLMAKASEDEKPIVILAWPDFAEILSLMMKHDLGIRVS
jgi:hypothetical protein